MMKTLRNLASALTWQACRVLPMKKSKVVFCSAGGRGFGDNPKAIALKLLELDPTLDLVWLARDVNTPLPKGIRVCRYGTPKAVMELSTAKVWVGDSRGGARVKRRKQRYLQTWHGFALKRIEKAARNLPASYIKQAMRDSAMTDLIVSGSEFMTQVFEYDFWYHGNVRSYGTPRNDVFFRDNSAVTEKVKHAFGLEKDRNIVLYAPTFRDNGSMDCYHLDVRGVVEACKERFGGEWSILCRLHPNIAEKSAGLFPYDEKTVLDASQYPDMQELLLSCDMLITDYSSSMFDYALRGKPCLRFATDLEAYTQGRGFYFQMDRIPFPLAESNKALLHEIREFDEEKQKENWNRFTKEQGFCEDGRASERCADWILRRIRGAKA